MRVEPFIFWTSLLVLVYVYGGYFLILRLAVALKRALMPERQAPSRHIDALPSVSVILAAHNEEKVIDRRVENILASSYPQEKLEIIVASDGSTDRTVAIAQEFSSPIIRVLDLGRGGKALTHNRAVESAKGEVLIFTDAEGLFDPAFIRNTVDYFRDPSVGCVTGNLFFRPEGDAISSSFNRYWEIEKEILALESELSILAKASGTCMALRKALWKPLSPADDTDFCAPLDAIVQGFRVVFGAGAVAFDVHQVTIKGEFRFRVRNASKNFVGILKRWGLKGWAQHPLVSLSLLSHKLLRLISAFFMVAILVSNLALLGGGLFWKLTLGAQFVFYSAALAGGLGERLDIRIPVFQTIFSYCVASLGMAIGVVKGLMGKAPIYH